MVETSYGISVLMSVYKNETPEYLRQAVESILNQTRKPDEIILVEDGPLTNELYKVLNELESLYPSIICRYPLSENVGLGLALKYGVEQCRFSLIARMDTDDLSVLNRLELQEKEFLTHQDLDAVGGHIAEFMSDPDKPIAYRYVPLEHNDIARYQRQRSALNHVTVMFKKDSVLKAGNYEHGLYMEDDLLWHNMISIGAKLKNLDTILCLVRIGDGMFERRGGGNYLKFYTQARKLMYDRRQISLLDLYSSIIVQFVVAIVPTNIRKWLFISLLRNSNRS